MFSVHMRHSEDECRAAICMRKPRQAKTVPAMQITIGISLGTQACNPTPANSGPKTAPVSNAMLIFDDPNLATIFVNRHMSEAQRLANAPVSCER